MAASVCGLVHLPDEPLDLVTEINERVFAPLIKDLIIRGNQAASWHVPDPGAATDNLEDAFVKVIGSAEGLAA